MIESQSVEPNLLAIPAHGFYGDVYLVGGRSNRYAAHSHMATEILAIDATMICPLVGRCYLIVGGLVALAYAQGRNKAASGVAPLCLQGESQCLAEETGLYMRVAQMYD